MTERAKLLTDDPQAREVVKAEWGSWLSTEWTWDWWVTLTFDPMTRDRGGRFAPGSATHTAIGWQRSSDSWDAWLSEIVAKPGLDGLSSVYWFRGREPNPNRRGTHFHALLGGVATVNRTAAWRSWFQEHGLARIEPYDPHKGAGWYVAKYVVKQLGDLRFSDNAGQFRRRRGDSSESDAERAAGELLPGGWQGQAAGNVPPW